MQSRGSITQSISLNEKDTTIAIGCCSHPGQESLTNRLEKTSFAADGSISNDLQLETIDGQLEAASLSEVLVQGEPFSCVAISAGKLLAGRDPLGQKPLYFGREKNGLLAVASLKRALEGIGIADPKAIRPGLAVSFSKTRESIVVDQTLTRPRSIKVVETEASRKLSELLLRSVEDGVPSGSALAFSGGLDSTLVAEAAKRNDLRPELITVAMKGQPELDHARRVADELGLSLATRELSAHEIFDAVPEVIETIESSDPVLIGISLPIYFVFETAQEMGMDLLLAGQLSDELFAGYGRFDEFAIEKKPRAAAAEIWRSVVAASTNDFETGDKLAVSHKMELRCPFAFYPLVRFALQLPVSLKLRTEGNVVIRKYILRRLASDWGLPSFVVNRPKKAVQYSTGVQKTLLKEARKKNLSLAGFLESLR